MTAQIPDWFQWFFCVHEVERRSVILAPNHAKNWVKHDIIDTIYGAFVTPYN